MERNSASLVVIGLALSACIVVLYNVSSDSIKTTGLLIGHGFLGTIFSHYSQCKVVADNFAQEICLAGRLVDGPICNLFEANEIIEKSLMTILLKFTERTSVC
jgi:hypothetical protein